MARKGFENERVVLILCVYHLIKKVQNVYNPTAGSISLSVSVSGVPALGEHRWCDELQTTHAEEFISSL